MSHVADRIGFSSWRGSTTLDENLFVRNFFIPPAAVPGWRIVRDREVPAAGIAARYFYLDSGDGGAIGVESYEYPSRTAAHDGLANMLKEFEAPDPPERRPGVGDVAFGVPGDALMLFARANLVLKVSRAERVPVRVADLAKSLDLFIVSKSAPADPHPRPRAGRREKERTIINVSPGPPREMIKVFGRGEITTDDAGNIVYRPAGDADEPVVLAHDESGSATRLQLNVKGR